MQLGMIGLGRMGSNMVRRLMRGGHQCVDFDLKAAAVRDLENEGATGSESLAHLVEQVATPRVVWLMVPAEAPTEAKITSVVEHLEAGDIVIDGGNSFYKDDVRRAHVRSGPARAGPRRPYRHAVPRHRGTVRRPAVGRPQPRPPARHAPADLDRPDPEPRLVSALLVAGAEKREGRSPRAIHTLLRTWWWPCTRTGAEYQCCGSVEH